MRGGKGVKLERRPEGGAAQAHALGRAHVEQLNALTAIEPPGQLLGGNRFRVGHRWSVVRPGAKRNRSTIAAGAV